MSEFLLSPDLTLALGKETYRLTGDFRTLKALQHAFARDLIPLQGSILQMRLDEIALFIATAAGADEERVGTVLLDDVGVMEVGYELLKAKLMTWLALAMTPKEQREKKAPELARQLEDLTGSLGANTSASASATSAGGRATSGTATSGKSPKRGKATPPPKD